MNDLHSITYRALVGVSGPILGVVASWQEHMEWGLRVASLAVGLAVGVISLIGLVRKIK